MMAELQIPAELAPCLDRLVRELRQAAPVDARAWRETGRWISKHEAREWVR